MKKYILKTSKSPIPIDADEIPEILRAISNGEVKVLRQGIFNPSFFDSIVPDTELMKKLSAENKPYTTVINGIMTTIEGKGIEPYEDQFQELRQQFKQVADGKHLLHD